jgi:hypothetical protein
MLPEDIALDIPDFALLRKFLVCLAPDAMYEPIFLKKLPKPI